MKTAEPDTMEGRRSKQFEETCEPEMPGLFGSVRRVLATALAMFQSRIELIAVEVREEKKRALAVVGWGVALVFLSIMSVVAVMGVVVFLLWENALAVLAGFSAFFLVAAVGSFCLARSQLQKIPFGETVAQLKKDRELVTEEKEGRD
ncbi:MAG: phage holin family protein [Verrucomicrobiota bacterium]